MHPSIEQNLPDITALCSSFGMRRLELFGSAARSVDFDPARSGADFLVEFDASRTRYPLERFFGLSEALRRLLGRPVDLVESGAVRNPYVMWPIGEARALVYEA